MDSAGLREPTAPLRNGSLPIAAVAGLLFDAKSTSDAGAHEMDTDQILQILMQMQKEGAGRDVKLDQVIVGQEDIKARLRSVDADIQELRKRDSEFERRIGSLEKQGFLAWLDGSAAKKIAILTGLIGGISVAVVALSKLVQWLSAHVRF